MTANVEKLAEQVRSLPPNERDEFLAWLAEYELEQADEWDAAIARDAQPGGPLDRVVHRVRKDIEAGRTKPLDLILDDT